MDISLEIFTIHGGILGDEIQFLHALRCEFFGFRDQGFRIPAPERAAYRGYGTIGASMGTPFCDLEIGTVKMGRPYSGDGVICQSGGPVDVKGGVTIGLMHGWGDPQGLEGRIAEAFKEESPHAVIYGHSHAPAVRQKGGILFFNPGTPTDKRFARSNTMGVLTLGQTIHAEIITL